MPKNHKVQLSDGRHLIPKAHRPPIVQVVAQVWVVDRFNQGEYEDFKKDDLVDSMQAYACFASLDAAKRSLLRDVQQEIDEELADLSKDQEDQETAEDLRNWKPEWQPEGRKPNWPESKNVSLETPHDGSIYTVRAIPLYT